MKRILGMAAAAALVLLQLGAIAVWSAEPSHDFSPTDGPQLLVERRA